MAERIRLPFILPFLPWIHGRNCKTTVDLTLSAVDPWQCYSFFNGSTAERVRPPVTLSFLPRIHGRKGKTTIDLTLSAVDPRQKGKDYHYPYPFCRGSMAKSVRLPLILPFLPWNHGRKGNINGSLTLSAVD